MSTKLSQKMKAHRTGQDYRMGPPPPAQYPNGGPAMQYPNGGNGNGPACGTLPPATPMSWGAACPPGQCSSEDLAANLNRAFAGERYGCRELPYWLSATVDANGVATFEQNSTVTICPTRVMFAAGGPDPLAFAATAVLAEFTMGNQNQVVGDPLPLALIATNSYQSIPFVTDCLKAGLPFKIRLEGLTVGDVVYFGILGPAVG